MQAAHQLCTEQAPRRPRPLHHGSPFPVFPGRGLGVRFLLTHPHPPPVVGGWGAGPGPRSDRRTTDTPLHLRGKPKPGPLATPAQPLVVSKLRPPVLVGAGAHGEGS